jgi:hypothetical protein
MQKLKKIHPSDNVYVVHNAIEAGELVLVDGQSLQFKQALTFGYKVAASDIAEGAPVIKFGVPIGSASQAIRLGDPVHIHNLKSNYLKTYTRDQEFGAS